jgi:predicted dinucleotide-binding enzyme
MEIKTIAILGGTGRQGSGLALRLAKKNRKIIIGSRSEEKAVSAATSLFRLRQIF